MKLCNKFKNYYLILRVYDNIGKMVMDIRPYNNYNKQQKIYKKINYNCSKYTRMLIYYNLRNNNSNF